MVSCAYVYSYQLYVPVIANISIIVPTVTIQHHLELFSFQLQFCRVKIFQVLSHAFCQHYSSVLAQVSQARPVILYSLSWRMQESRDGILFNFQASRRHYSMVSSVNAYVTLCCTSAAVKLGGFP